MADGIWMIEETSFEAVEWGRMTHSAVDTDLGYYTTFREAQKACNRLNAAQMLRYDEAVNRVLQRNAGVALSNDKRLEDWKAEVAAGRVLSPPWLERLDRVPTFDGWCYENILRYEPVEVAPAAAEEGTQEAGGCPHAAWQDLGHALICEDCGERLGPPPAAYETRKATGITRLSEAVDAADGSGFELVPYDYGVVPRGGAAPVGRIGLVKRFDSGEDGFYAEPLRGQYREFQTVKEAFKYVVTCAAPGALDDAE